jgi:hypothetical protein
MGRGRSSPPVSFSADNFLEFLESKSSTVRQQTSSADSPTFSVASSDCAFSDFHLLSYSDVSFFSSPLA